MEKEQATRILNALANGIHPATGEKFAADSPYQHPDTMSDKPVSPCGRCWREIDEQTTCGALNCPCIQPATEEKGEPFHRCDNCGAEFPEAFDFGPEIPHIWERVSAGELFPSGECPACESLCHPIINAATKASA